MNACDECGALPGVHQRGCPADIKSGHALGKKRRRTSAQTVQWAAIASLRKLTDGYRCRRCASSWQLDCHHVETVQQVLARGGTYDDADKLDNLRTLCRTCHEWVHAGVNYDLAVAGLWLAPNPNRITTQE